MKVLVLPVKRHFALKVTVADGESLGTRGICENVGWLCQGVEFQNDFMVLPLKGCDLVLGVQWLVSLGPIIWNFEALTMKFQYHGDCCELKGL